MDSDTEKRLKPENRKACPKNLVWGMDLTGKTAIQGNLIHILGIVEHKSRQSLSLSTLKNKASVYDTTDICSML